MVLSTSTLDNRLDSVSVDPAHHEVLFENDQVRVVRWAVAAGDTTLYHSHPDNLNICLTDYNGSVSAPHTETFNIHAKAGSADWRKKCEHAVANIGSHRMEGILVEPKQPGSLRPNGSSDPVIIDPEHHTVEFENDYIRVLRERRGLGRFPMHGHPDNVQVLLTDLKAALTGTDGTTEIIKGKAGDVRWRFASQHKGEVLGEKPVEQIIIEMKGNPAPR